ncbi:MAG: hypothetical protein NT086_01905 [Proteobacteria bacterium]|nr:hypothetical protein [Pseudomonadota bacterium]
MLVKAASGLSVPKEDSPREYIGDSNAELVPDSQYYLRRVMEGDLLLQADPSFEEGPDLKPANRKTPAGAA